jgi:hypothetical protein
MLKTVSCPAAATAAADTKHIQCCACRDTTIALKPKFTLPAGAPSPKKLCPGASYSLKVQQHCTAAGMLPFAQLVAPLQPIWLYVLHQSVVLIQYHQSLATKFKRWA